MSATSMTARDGKRCEMMKIMCIAPLASLVALMRVAQGDVLDECAKRCERFGVHQEVVWMGERGEHREDDEVDSVQGVVLARRRSCPARCRRGWCGVARDDEGRMWAVLIRLG